MQGVSRVEGETSAVIPADADPAIRVSGMGSAFLFRDQRYGPVTT